MALIKYLKRKNINSDVALQIIVGVLKYDYSIHKILYS